MLRSLSGSYKNGKMLRVEYKLKLHVRYGNLWKSVTFAEQKIDILQKPSVVPDGRYVEAPINWAPTVYQQSNHSLPIAPPN